jgi:hypothetical protein
LPLWILGCKSRIQKDLNLRPIDYESIYRI